jgi:hypothetical protein
MPANYYESIKDKELSEDATNVGWALLDFPSSVIWGDPEPVGSLLGPFDEERGLIGSTSDARLCLFRSPIDLHLRFYIDKNGYPNLQNVDGDKSSVRQQMLSQLVQLTAKNEWRHPERPIIQIMTPYICLADTSVYINQMPAYMHYSQSELPGLMIDGRFPIDVWPRQLMWAFEWYDVKKEINLKRGDPWFYTKFETQDPEQAVNIVECDLTPEVKKYIQSLNGVTNYVKQTFSLFAQARKRRPKKLLFPVDRN